MQMLKERLEFLKGPGGIRAAGYFGLKIFIRIDVFHVFWIVTRSYTSLILPPGWRFVSLHTAGALSDCSKHIIEQAANQCGTSPKSLVERGGSLHLLLAGDSLVAQLNIERGPSCRINAPSLHLAMGESDAFLSHLYTWPEYRRQGAARYLIAASVNNLSMYKIRRVIAHVRATNVPSLAAFEHAGWKNGATIICTLSGRLLTAFGAARAGLTFHSTAK